MNANSTEPPQPRHPSTNNFVHILMGFAMNFNGSSHLAERTIKRNGEREREKVRKVERGEGTGVPDYFSTRSQPLISLATPLISLLELICKSMAVAVGLAALSRSAPVISGSSSPSTPHTLDASLPDN